MPGAVCTKSPAPKGITKFAPFAHYSTFWYIIMVYSCVLEYIIVKGRVHIDDMRLLWEDKGSNCAGPLGVWA